MTGAHIHLLVNHFPIVAAYFALGLFVISFFWQRNVVERLALVALVVVGITGFVSKMSGGGAIGDVRGLPGITRATIGAHAEFAETSTIVAGLVAIVALGILIRWRRAGIPRGASAVALVGTLVVTGMMSYVGLLGGRVRHSEVRPNATPADASIVEPAPPRGQRPPED